MPRTGKSSRSDVFFSRRQVAKEGGILSPASSKHSRYFNGPRANIFARAKRFRNTKGTPTPVNTCHASFVLLPSFPFSFFFSFFHRLFFLCSTRVQRSLRHGRGRTPVFRIVFWGGGGRRNLGRRKVAECIFVE